MSLSDHAVLHLVCGSHFSQQATVELPHPATRQIARRFKAELICQPDWQQTKQQPGDLRKAGNPLSPEARIKIETQVLDQLAQGHNVVLDIPANTPQIRQWLKTLVDKTGSRHLLHYLVSSAPLHKQVDDEKKERLKTDFVPPKVEEGFNVEVSPYGGLA